MWYYLLIVYFCSSKITKQQQKRPSELKTYFVFSLMWEFFFQTCLFKIFFFAFFCWRVFHSPLLLSLNVFRNLFNIQLFLSCLGSPNPPMFSLKNVMKYLRCPADIWHISHLDDMIPLSYMAEIYMILS